MNPFSSVGQPKSARGPNFLKIVKLRAKIWTFSKDLWSVVDEKKLT